MLNKGLNKEQKDLRGVKRILPWVGLCAILVFTSAVRLRLLDVPFERDEGEYAYGGQLILEGLGNGVPLQNIKPTIYTIYALIMSVFGQSPQGIHFGLLCINTTSILLLFLIAWRLYNARVAVASAAIYALLSLGPSVQGMLANREHFVMVFALGGMFVLWRAIERQKGYLVFIGSLLLGTTILIRPNGAAFIMLMGLTWLFYEVRRKPFSLKIVLSHGVQFLLGTLLPFALLCLVLASIGKFETWRLWRFEITRQYAADIPLSAGADIFKMRIAHVASPVVVVWILAGTGLIVAFFTRAVRQHRVFTFGMASFSFLAICPGLYFRPHYFQMLLPAVSIFAAISADFAHDLFAKWRFSAKKIAWGLVVVAAIFHGIFRQRKVFFSMSPSQVSRSIYGVNPFPESLEIARYIKDHSTQDDTIAVLGSEPQIYFYSKRRAATGHMYTYHLMANYDLSLAFQEQMIEEIESKAPKFLIFVNVPTSWLVRPESDKTLFEWFGRHHQEYYEVAGIADIFGYAPTIYRWNEDAANYSPRSPYWVGIYKRKDP